MKTRFITSLIVGLLLFTAAGLHAQGTAFTYDGKLNDGAGPANGVSTNTQGVRGTNSSLGGESRSSSSGAADRSVNH